MDNYLHIGVCLSSFFIFLAFILGIAELLKDYPLYRIRHIKFTRFLPDSKRYYKKIYLSYFVLFFFSVGVIMLKIK